MLSTEPGLALVFMPKLILVLLPPMAWSFPHNLDFRSDLNFEPMSSLTWENSTERTGTFTSLGAQHVSAACTVQSVNAALRDPVTG